MAVCGSGLGSSFMLEMNINGVLKEMGITDITVEHTDLGSVTPDMADIFVASLDLADGMRALPELLILNNIIDKVELKTKLTEMLTKHGKI